MLISRFSAMREKPASVKKVAFCICAIIAIFRITAEILLAPAIPVLSHVVFWADASENVDYLATIVFVVWLMVESSVFIGFLFSKTVFLYVFILLNVTPIIILFTATDMPLVAQGITVVVSGIAFFFATLGIVSIKAVEKTNAGNSSNLVEHG